MAEEACPDQKSISLWLIEYLTIYKENFLQIQHIISVAQILFCKLFHLSIAKNTNKIKKWFFDAFCSKCFTFVDGNKTKRSFPRTFRRRKKTENHDRQAFRAFYKHYNLPDHPPENMIAFGISFHQGNTGSHNNRVNRNLSLNTVVWQVRLGIVMLDGTFELNPT